MSWQQAREDTLDRDGYECQFCGMTNDEHQAKHDQGLHAHHILKDREGGRDVPENLITVCKSCHETLEKTHARAIAELKRQRENERELETKLERLSYTWQQLRKNLQNTQEKLAEYVENNPLTAEALGVWVEDGDIVNSEELRVSQSDRVSAGPVDSEFRFAAMWGYKEGLCDALSNLRDEDSDLATRDVSKIRRDRIKYVKTLISRIDAETPDEGAPIETILDDAEEIGFERSEAEHEIEKLRRQGDVYEPTTDHLRTV